MTAIRESETSKAPLPSHFSNLRLTQQRYTQEVNITGFGTSYWS